VTVKNPAATIQGGLFHQGLDPRAITLRRQVGQPGRRDRITVSSTAKGSGWECLHAQPKMKLTSERSPFAHQGEELAQLSEDLALLGGDFALVGEDFAWVGGDLALVTSPFAQVGGELALVDERLARFTSSFALVGEHFPKQHLL
jgi:hypothetical protein